MKQISRVIMALVFLTLVGCKSSYFVDQDKRWMMLGQRKANHLREGDVFKIDSRDRFTDIRVYAIEKDLIIKRMNVYLVNGDVLTPMVDGRIAAGEHSNNVSLGMEGRQIDHVTIRYKSDGKFLSRKGLVQLGGRIVNQDTDRDRR